MTGAALILATQSPDATSAPVEAPASKVEVLQPATADALNAVPAETRMQLDYMTARPALISEGAAAAVDVSEVGVVNRPDGTEVTVAAIGGDICAFLAGGVGGCDDGARVAAGQSFSAEPIGCDGYRVLGVAPDGVTEIAVDSRADGSVDVTLPVTSNVYVGTLDPVQTVATGLDEDGEPRFSVGIPLDSYAAMNEACK
ncbi:MAG TPA: hypothetical protein VJU14_08575 [Solirubrobacterales bacterium]|nr:hypothetical protein [Solirubrobacterales bacterium]